MFVGHRSRHGNGQRISEIPLYRCLCSEKIEKNSFFSTFFFFKNKVKKKETLLKIHQQAKRFELPGTFGIGVMKNSLVVCVQVQEEQLLQCNMGVIKITTTGVCAG